MPSAALRRKKRENSLKGMEAWQRVGWETKKKNKKKKKPTKKDHRKTPHHPTQKKKKKKKKKTPKNEGAGLRKGRKNRGMREKGTAEPLGEASLDEKSSRISSERDDVDAGLQKKKRFRRKESRGDIKKKPGQMGEWIRTPKEGRLGRGRA